MDFFFDWLLILTATGIVISAYKRVVFQENCSVANYVIVVLYVFCVLPIICNYTLGLPQYKTIYWYKPFIEPMVNVQVGIMYDLYIMLCIILLYIFCARKNRGIVLTQYNSLTSIVCNNRVISTVLIFLPIIYIALTGSWKYYVTYAVSSARGLTESNKMALMTPCMLISMIVYFGTVLKNNLTMKKIILTFLYSVSIVWISGKRFMLANILLLFIFYTANMDIDVNGRKKIYRILPILGIVLIGFSVFYLAVIRPMAETSSLSIYDMLRVDFGRDDVIKYVINKEIIRGERILEYRGETFLSLIGSFIPRKVWPSKPYPHYMYLTGSILNLGIHNLPAGTTPSLLEMTICNFGFWGFAAGIILLIWICKMIDRSRDVDTKSIGLILAMVLLTQSMDVYLILVVVLIAINIMVKFFKGRMIRIVIHR